MKWRIVVEEKRDESQKTLTTTAGIQCTMQKVELMNEVAEIRVVAFGPNGSGKSSLTGRLNKNLFQRALDNLCCWHEAKCDLVIHDFGEEDVAISAELQSFNPPYSGLAYCPKTPDFIASCALILSRFLLNRGFFIVGPSRKYS
ncbi:unnamed protein product [Cyclocybe aegerita]|uniref:Uncharacterized protein n=1 Tax=Cyclocybe aegerita TaxID=1973307 RepID=A0A8S0WPS3_CYCAE|nr:unnamed protein product [Cyclocybe aegerita]